MHEDGTTTQLVREGDYWTLIHDGVVTRLHDRKGLAHLAQLLARPHVEVHALDLASGATSPSLTPEPMLDARAKASYRERLQVLRDHLEDARERGDSVRADAFANEIDLIAMELARAVGLGNRDRTAPSDAERARVNATRTIRDAIARIARAHDWLGHHLSTSIRTGTFCSYNPHPSAALRWDVMT